MIQQIEDKLIALEVGDAPNARDVFEEVGAWVRRYVVLDDNQAIAVALWVMMTHAVEAFDCVPYLSLTSAEKQSGKTRLLEVLERIVARPWLTGRTTAAVLARKIDAEHPSLLLDESDAAFRGEREYAETLRGVLNTGYLRSGKTSLCVTRGKRIEFADLSTFGPKAIAGIGSLPDTVADRSIPIRLQRKLATESVHRFRLRSARGEGDNLRARLNTWARAYIAQPVAEPSLPDELPDRAADICEPLLAIAEHGGDDVAAAARAALVALCGRQREDESLGVRLLADIRTIFTDCGDGRMQSSTLAAKLAAIEESPWGPRFGRDFDARQLANRLRPFSIYPRALGSTTARRRRAITATTSPTRGRASLALPRKGRNKRNIRHNPTKSGLFRRRRPPQNRHGGLPSRHRAHRLLRPTVRHMPRNRNKKTPVK